MTTSMHPPGAMGKIRWAAGSGGACIERGQRVHSFEFKVATDVVILWSDQRNSVR